MFVRHLLCARHLSRQWSKPFSLAAWVTGYQQNPREEELRSYSGTLYISLWYPFNKLSVVLMIGSFFVQSFLNKDLSSRTLVGIDSTLNLTSESGCPWEKREKKPSDRRLRKCFSWSGSPHLEEFAFHL